MRNTKILSALIFVVTLAVSASSLAVPIEFIPPNDPTGRVATTNVNDGWSRGRGIVFRVLADFTISSVGLFHNLNGVDLSYELATASSLTGNVGVGTILASGGSTVTTSGLEWIDFAITPMTLLAGNLYHLEFTFSGNGVQNFFYDNRNIAWTQGAFEALEGTANTNASNTAVAAFRLHGETTVPEPGSLLLMGLGLLAAARGRRLS